MKVFSKSVGYGKDKVEILQSNAFCYHFSLIGIEEGRY